MANPQKENGYTPIANEIMEAIYSSPFNATQLKILLFILRYTYGFSRKEHKMSLSFIAKGTSISKRYVSSELKKLVELNVVQITQHHTDTEARTLRLNKDYETWENRIPLQVKDCSTGEELDTTTDEELFHTTGEELFHQDKQYLKQNLKQSKECKINLFEFLKTCKDSPPHDEYFEEHGKPHPNYYMIQEFSKLPEEKKTGTLVRIYMDIFPEQKKKGIAGSVKANQVFSALLDYPMCPDHETILKLLLYHEGGNLTPWDVERKIKELRPGEITKEQMCYSMDEGMAENGQALC